MFLFTQIAHVLVMMGTDMYFEHLSSELTMNNCKCQSMNYRCEEHLIGQRTSRGDFGPFMLFILSMKALKDLDNE